MATQKRPRTRKSIAHMPSGDVKSTTTDLENLGANNTISFDFKSANDTSTVRKQKSRSRSLGPGGLDPLQEGTGNRRQSVTTPRKSILKPTIPLSPLKQIPSRKPNASPRSPAKSPRTNLSKQSSRPASSPDGDSNESRTRKANDADDIQVADERITERTSDNEQEFKAREERQKQKDEIQKQREARRKSMANRRVSFAPEATLHTWDVIYDAQDTTTSSEATDSTRRASSASNLSSLDSQTNTSASTSSEQDLATEQSPDQRRDVNQKKRRRSSGIYQLSSASPSEVGSSSPFSDTPKGVEDATTTSIEEPNSPNESDSGLNASESSTSSQMEIDEGASELFSAPDVNGREIRDDDHGSSPASIAQDGAKISNRDEELEDISMDLAGDDITAAFQVWARQSNLLDKENIDPDLLNNLKEDDSGHDMSMDMTKAVGRIFSTSQLKDGLTSIKSHSAQHSTAQVVASGGSETTVIDATMDFTTAVGGIQTSVESIVPDIHIANNEDLSMDCTTAFGIIHSAKQSSPSGENQDRLVIQSVPESQNYISNIVENDQPIDMDFTAAVGGLIDHSPNLMSSNETHVEQSTGSGTSSKIERRFAAAQTSATNITTYTPSPPRGSDLSKTSTFLLTSATGSPAPVQSRIKHAPTLTSPAKLQSSPKTPSKQPTPRPPKLSTSEKTPPSRNTTMKISSPEQLSRSEMKDSRMSLSPAKKLFQSRGSGQHTPSVVLHPHTPLLQQSSTKTTIRSGFGSPKVTAILDKRASIGEQASIFTPERYENRVVQFTNPYDIEAEVLQEREVEVQKESAFYSMDLEFNEEPEKDATLTLKEAITSMTPKKSKLKGRKSLALGTAKGVLGKRPLELDEDDGESTPSPVKGSESSPVKRIRLHAPPSLTDTTGRPKTPKGSTLINATVSTTPRTHEELKNTEAVARTQNPLPKSEHNLSSTTSNMQCKDEAKEKIQLQDFLNMTNIRFMELTTTKRRHTIVPNNKTDKAGEDVVDSDSGAQEKAFVESVIAGACTIPMLELYQHSCRELKKYISEGRGIVREIEEETYRENPPLFSEYLSASPTQRKPMDDMFKNMKTNARFQSKGMWYEWRMKLLEGLKEGLVTIADDLAKDNIHVSKQEQILESVYPSMVERHAQLRIERDELQAQAEEIAECDQDQLRESREKLVFIDQEISEKKQALDTLRQQLQAMDEVIQEANEAKNDLIENIKEAQGLHEDYHGWSIIDVAALKGRIKEMEVSSGWKIASASSSTVTLHYRGQLQCCCNLASFLQSTSNQTAAARSPISLTYIGGSSGRGSSEIKTEERFFLQILQSHIQKLAQDQTRVKDLLHLISTTWETAGEVSKEVHLLKKESITECSILSDERMLITAVILLPDVTTKVHVGFEIGASATETSLKVEKSISAAVVYGEQYREAKMREFLSSKVGGTSIKTKNQGEWVEGISDLKRRLIAQGRKR